MAFMSRDTCRAMAVCLLLIGVPAGGLLLSQGPALADAEVRVDFKLLRKQGLHYYRKKLWGPAMSTLRKAAATPKGKTDFRTHYYLAKCCETTLQLEKAFPAAEKALKFARSEDDKAEAKKLLETLKRYYAGVRFEQHPDQPGKFEKGGLIILKPTKPIINMKKKQVFDKIAARFKATPVHLPITIYLPFGEYEANGAPFKIARGKEAKAQLFLYNPEGDTMSWWWIVGGGAAAAGLTAGILLPILLSEDTQKARVGTISLFPEPETSAQ